MASPVSLPRRVSLERLDAHRAARGEHAVLRAGVSSGPAPQFPALPFPALQFPALQFPALPFPALPFPALQCASDAASSEP